jgi:hypothetical protein
VADVSDRNPSLDPDDAYDQRTALRGEGMRRPCCEMPGAVVVLTAQDISLARKHFDGLIWPPHVALANDTHGLILYDV